VFARLREGVMPRGMFGVALFLTALTTILSGLLLPEAVKSIIFGLVIVAAVVGLRERTG